MGIAVRPEAVGNPAHLVFRDRLEVTGIPWKVTAGTGVLSRTTTDAEFSSYGAALKLTTSTVSAEACEVHRFHAPFNNAQAVVFGGRFAVMDENLSNFAFYTGYRDGTNWYRSKMLHVLSTNLWQYDAGGSGSAALTTLLTRDTSEVSSRGVWHTFALGADFGTNKHLGWVIDDQDFTVQLAETSLRQAADSATPNLLDFAIETTNTTGSPSASVIIFDELWAVAMQSGTPAQQAVNTARFVAQNTP